MLLRFSSDNPVLARIRLAKKRLQDKRNWTRGQNIMPNGQRCLYGALLPNGKPDTISYEAAKVVASVIKGHPASAGSVVGIIQQYNDSSTTRHPDILAVLDKAEGDASRVL